MRSHVVATVRPCFRALHQIHSVRHSLTRQTLQSLVHALVVSKVDYCNSVLAGISGHFWTDCSPCWMLPPGQSSRQGGQNTSAHYSVNSAACEFRKEFDSGCVFWHFTACLHGTAPSYLVGSLRRAADVDGSRHLRSTNTVSLVVSSTQHTTLGDRSFPVAAARAWNNLPPTIRASPSLLTFHQQLKTFLFLTTFYWLNDGSQWTELYKMLLWLS